MSEPEAMAAGREDARRLRAKLAARSDGGQCLVCGKPAKGRTVAGEQACLAHGAQPGPEHVTIKHPHIVPVDIRKIERGTR